MPARAVRRRHFAFQRHRSSPRHSYTIPVASFGFISLHGYLTSIWKVVRYASAQSFVSAVVSCCSRGEGSAAVAVAAGPAAGVILILAD